MLSISDAYAIALGIMGVVFVVWVIIGMFKRGDE